MDRSSYALGGIVLILSAVIWSLGGATHPVQPETLEAFGELGSAWTFSHAALFAGGALTFIGALFLARHFQGGPAEGSAIIATGALALASIAGVLLGAIETTGFAGLLAAQEAGAGAAADHAYLAATHVMISTTTIIGFLFPVALLGYSLAMTKDAGWPGWLAWLGIVVGALSLAELVFDFALPLGPLAFLWTLAGSIWVLLTGLFFMRQGKAAEAAPV